MKTTKKILLLLVLLLGQQAWAFAENRLYIEDFQIAPGATKTVSVMLENDDPAGTIQFRVVLPSGLSWSNVAKGTRTSTGYSLSYNDTDGMVQLGKSASADYLTAGEGSVLTFDVTAANNFAGGNITLSDMSISTTGYNNLTLAETATTAVTVQVVEVTATESVSFNTSGTGTIEVSLSNDIPVATFTAFFQLPANVSYVDKSLKRGARVPESADCMISDWGDGLYKVILNTKTIDDPIFTGNEGVVFSFEVSAAVAVTGNVVINSFEIFNRENTSVKYTSDPVSVSVTVESSAQTVVLDAENSDELTFEAGTAEQVRVIRKLAEKGKWSTIVLPFTISKPNFVKYAFAEGATDNAIQVANLNYVQDIDIDGQFVKDTGKKAVGIDVNFKTGNRIAANTPTLIKVLEDGYKGEFTVPKVTLSIPTINDDDQNAYLDVEFSVENYPVTFMQIDQESDGWINNANVFMGTYKKMTNIGGNNGGNGVTKDYYIKDNKFYQCVNTTIKPTRAFFSLHYSEFDPTGSESMTNVRIKITDEEGNVEEVTAIDNVQLNTPSATDSAIYNLQGQRVKTAQKGLYIQNGKKYLVR